MMPVDKRIKSTILFIASWAAVVLLASLILIKFPGYYSEHKRLTTLKAQLSDRNELESRMNAFISAFKTRAETISSDISSRQSKLAGASFSRFKEEDLPGFVDNLPKIVASAGVKLANLGYKPKESLEGFVDQTFELLLSGQYPQIRQLLHALETHPAGVIIETLEFVTLNDSQQEAQLRLQCRVRFLKDG